MAVNSAQTLTGTSSVFKRKKLNGYAFLISVARQIEYGAITIYLPGGIKEEFVGHKPGPRASLRILRPRMVRRVLLGGSIGFAESFIDNDWTSEDLTCLLELASLNSKTWNTVGNGNKFALSLNRLRHYLRPNTVRGSKKNIAAHYDLGNEFYRLWLDQSMSYSAGLYEGKNITLDQAQERKTNRLLSLLDISSGDSLLEIGSGWGRFAINASKKTQCNVSAVTISSEQFNESKLLCQSSGADRSVNFMLQDYRDIKGKYDKIVSIEMIEAVGESYWETYFSKLKSLLSPGGRIALQAITIDEEAYENYRVGVDFIQRYIFPGGMLPTKELLMDLSKNAGFKWLYDRSHAEDYALTLKAWRQRFEESIPEIRKMGFDDKFCRTWKYYLSYCEAGFRTKRTNVYQIVLSDE
jgi:cyclopropane-fatty-acyl-phospholipid synthase|tara:strand:- start:61 stop:1290 length:1230 start_codon:yes stop_codon:yes gene_type:complete